MKIPLAEQLETITRLGINGTQTDMSDLWKVIFSRMDHDVLAQRVEDLASLLGWGRERLATVLAAALLARAAEDRETINKLAMMQPCCTDRHASDGPASKGCHASLPSFLRQPRAGLLNILQDVADSNMCHKRVVVCALYDEDCRLLAAATNTCSPPNDICGRVANPNKSVDYSECNSTCAEKNALFALPPGSRAVYADVYGKNSCCEACKKLLREFGVLEVNFVEGLGAGRIQR